MNNETVSAEPKTAIQQTDKAPQPEDTGKGKPKTAKLPKPKLSSLPWKNPLINLNGAALEAALEEAATTIVQDYAAVLGYEKRKTLNAIHAGEILANVAEVVPYGALAKWLNERKIKEKSCFRDRKLARYYYELPSDAERQKIAAMTITEAYRAAGILKAPQKLTAEELDLKRAEKHIQEQALQAAFDSLSALGRERQKEIEADVTEAAKKAILAGDGIEFRFFDDPADAARYAAVKCRKAGHVYGVLLYTISSVRMSELAIQPARAKESKPKANGDENKITAPGAVELNQPVAIKQSKPDAVQAVKSNVMNGGAQ